MASHHMVKRYTIFSMNSISITSNYNYKSALFEKIITTTSTFQECFKRNRKVMFVNVFELQHAFHTAANCAKASLLQTFSIVLVKSCFFQNNYFIKLNRSTKIFFSMTRFV